MLIECPECNLQVSDKAITCPHCGYPLKQPSKRPYNPSKAHKRLPNGFGQITKIKRLRHPYRAMVTVGKTEYGKPICKLLKPQSYFDSYNDAYKALMEYNKNPYDLTRDLTIEELHNLWWQSNSARKLTESTQKVYISAWKLCSGVYDVMLSEFRKKHIRLCMDSTDSYTMQKLMKVIFTQILDYAVQYEYVDRNIAREYKLDTPAEVSKSHMAFTDEEFAKLWKHKNFQYVDLVLIQCYTGLRPQELMLLKTENIHLEQNVIYGGMKTKAGTNRAIPIHPAIKPLVEKKYQMNKDCEYLFGKRNNKPYTYSFYFKAFTGVMSALNLSSEHRPHDPRKHFVTMCKKYNVDEYAIKRIVGHAIADITENIYTERDISWLYSEVCKVPNFSV